MLWLETAVLLAAGLLFCRLGWRIGKRGEIALIHDYHWQHISDADRKPYTAKMGLGVQMIGAGAILTALLCLASAPPLRWLALGAGFGAGLCLILYAQIRYNHGIF